MLESFYSILDTGIWYQRTCLIPDMMCVTVNKISNKDYSFRNIIINIILQTKMLLNSDIIIHGNIKHNISKLPNVPSEKLLYSKIIKKLQDQHINKTSVFISLSLSPLTANLLPLYSRNSLLRLPSLSEKLMSSSTSSPSSSSSSSSAWDVCASPPPFPPSSR